MVHELLAQNVLFWMIFTIICLLGAPRFLATLKWWTIGPSHKTLGRVAAMLEGRGLQLVRARACLQNWRAHNNRSALRAEALNGHGNIEICYFEISEFLDFLGMSPVIIERRDFRAN